MLKAARRDDMIMPTRCKVGRDETVRNGKRVLAGLLVMLCVVSWCAAGTAAHNTVTINGLVYKLSNPKNYTDLQMVKV